GGAGRALPPQPADAACAWNRERRRRDREPERQEGEQRVDGDGVLDLHERDAPHGGHEDERGERGHRAIVAPIPWSAMKVLDTLARPLRDLRISVTDRCNFRCVYCM